MSESHISEKKQEFKIKRRRIEKIYILSFFIMVGLLILLHIGAHLAGVYNRQLERFAVPAFFIAWLICGLVLDRWAKQQPCPYCGEPTGIKLVWPRNFICKRCWHDLKL